MSPQVALYWPSAGGAQTMAVAGIGIWTTTLSPYFSRHLPFTSVCDDRTSLAVRLQPTTVWLWSPVSR